VEHPHRAHYIKEKKRQKGGGKEGGILYVVSGTGDGKGRGRPPPEKTGGNGNVDAKSFAKKKKKKAEGGGSGGVGDYHILGRKGADKGPEKRGSGHSSEKGWGKMVCVLLLGTARGGPEQKERRK